MRTQLRALFLLVFGVAMFLYTCDIRRQAARWRTRIINVQFQASTSNFQEDREPGMIPYSGSSNDVELSQKQQEFLKHWCRVQNARVDWKALLSPCSNNITWEANMFRNGQPTDAVKSFITRTEIRPAGEFSRFVIQSVSISGERKSIGGDSWRAHLRGRSVLTPTIFDHGNGSYEFMFLVMEPGFYSVEIYLDYTLCEGVRDPPTFWYNRGNVQGKNQPDGTLQGAKPYLMHKFAEVQFQILPPQTSGWELAMKAGNLKCACPTFLWHGLGRWRGDTCWVPYLTESLKPIRHKKMTGVLWIYGDSVTNHFSESLTTGPYKEICSQVFRSCRKTYNWIYNMRGYWGNGVTSPKEPVPDGKDFDHNRVLDDVREVLYDPAMDEDSVLIINWGIHFVAAVSFTSYQRVLREFVRIVRYGEFDPQTKQTRKCKGKVIWKTTSAINRDRFPHPHKDVRRFLTVPRVLLYNAYANSVMCDAGIDVIDIYPMSDAYPKGTSSPTDPVHYSWDVFRDVEGQLYQTFYNAK